MRNVIAGARVARILPALMRVLTQSPASELRVLLE